MGCIFWCVSGLVAPQFAIAHTQHCVFIGVQGSRDLGALQHVTLIGMTYKSLVGSIDTKNS
jgi:hypothetical protein